MPISDQKIKQLITEFAKNNDFDSHELRDGISVLKRYHWNVPMTKIVINLNLDSGELLSIEDVHYIEKIFAEKLQGTPTVELSSEGKLASIQKLFSTGYCSFDYEELQKVLDKLEF